MIKEYSLKKDKKLRLSKNFILKEFACADKSDKVLVSEEMVEILQRVRDYFKKPITITSGYRTKTHNEKVGGVKNSFHTTGEAVDFAVRGVSPAAVGYLLAEMDAPGVGIYVSSKFTHLDVRENGKWRGIVYGGREESFKEFFPQVSLWDTGNEVKLLQTLLKCKPDGIFGQKTLAEVCKFQKKHGLAVDGIVGVLTWRKLSEK